MNGYSIEIVDNHIISLIDGKRVLLDTGAPNSISDGSYLAVLGNVYSFSRNFMGFSIDEISRLVGTEINILLGGDVLTNLNFFVDWDRKTLLFSSTQFEHQGPHVPLDFFMNIPILPLYVDRANLRVFLDTGAKISYLNPDITSNHNHLGRTSDFYPGFGQFYTDIYEVPVMLAYHTFTVIAGHLPTRLQNTLMMANTQGILGNDIFKYFNVCFNFQVKKIILVTRKGNAV